MNTKLTLRLDEDLIAEAKRHARRSGRSISQLVADFFTLIAESEAPAITPRVASLRGALRSSSGDVADYRRHLEEKYR